MNQPLTKADADFTREVTEFAIGGIPLLGHKQIIELIFIDEDLLKFESVWAAARPSNAVFNFQGKDLLARMRGWVISLA